MTSDMELPDGLGLRNGSVMSQQAQEESATDKAASVPNEVYPGVFQYPGHSAFVKLPGTDGTSYQAYTTATNATAAVRSRAERHYPVYDAYLAYLYHVATLRGWSNLMYADEWLYSDGYPTPDDREKFGTTERYDLGDILGDVLFGIAPHVRNLPGGGDPNEPDVEPVPDWIMDANLSAQLRREVLAEGYIIETSFRPVGKAGPSWVHMAALRYKNAIVWSAITPSTWFRGHDHTRTEQWKMSVIEGITVACCWLNSVAAPLGTKVAIESLIEAYK